MRHIPTIVVLPQPKSEVIDFTLSLGWYVHVTKFAIMDEDIPARWCLTAPLAQIGMGQTYWIAGPVLRVAPDGTTLAQANILHHFSCGGSDSVMVTAETLAKELNR